jgi:MFS transporter, MHS family, proline/betaine transporter
MNPSKKIPTTTLLKIGLLANTFEWYEFSVFSFLSIIIGRLFFKSDLPIIELLQTFTLFAVSYLVRPLGSIFFGILGDQRGRRYVLRLSLILMTVPTVLIGCLPTYEQIGITATLTLIILRMIQGFAMGGELPATACYVFEAANPRQRSILCSAVGAAPKIGMLLGALANYLVINFFDEGTLLAWGWRIPFLIGIPLTLFIAYVRQEIQETADFVSINRPSNTRSTQLSSMIAPLVQAICLCCFLNVMQPILTIWMPFYLSHFLNIPAAKANLINMVGLCAMIPFCLVAGSLSQYVGVKKLFTGSILATFILIVPLFYALRIYTYSSVLLGLQLIFAALMGIPQGICIEIFNNLFKPENRSLGVSLACILPAALIGGTVPLVCTYVIHKTGWLMFPAFYIILSGLIALPAALRLREKLELHTSA